MRVEEANNPGPRRQCRYRFASSFLVGPIEGRDVIPRIEPRIETSPNIGQDVFPRVDGSSVTVPLTKVGSIVSPTVSPVPNMGAIQQTLLDTDSQDGKTFLQLETPPKNVINALKAVLVGCVAPGHQ